MDGPANARIYNRFIGCQVSTVLDFKKDKAALSVLSSVITYTVGEEECRLRRGEGSRPCGQDSGEGGRPCSWPPSSGSLWT